MEHIIQIPIHVEDDRIVKQVEKNAENQIIKALIEKVEDEISRKTGWRNDARDYTPLKNMISDKISLVLEENKDFILSEASKMLANKLARSKAGKEILTDLKENGN